MDLAKPKGKWQSLATAIMLQPVLYANSDRRKISYSLIFSLPEKISIKIQLDDFTA
jgi:hypothetical protein